MKWKLRYSVTGLLAAILLMGLPLAWVHYQLHERAVFEQQLRARLKGKHRGVFLGYSPHLPKHWLYGFFEDTRNVNQICKVRLGGDFNDADLPVLDEIPSLEEIELYETRVTDEGLMHLAGRHPRLSILNIHGRAVTKEGVARFKRARPSVQVTLNYRVVR
jgi:hypothetical protein